MIRTLITKHLEVGIVIIITLFGFTAKYLLNFPDIAIGYLVGLATGLFIKVIQNHKRGDV